MSFMSITSTWSSTPTKRTHVLVRLFNKIRREIELRRAIREVSSLDERTLVDIGLSTGGFEDAVRRGRRYRS